MNELANRYLAAFNEIEKLFKNLLNAHIHIPFSEMVRRLSVNNSHIRRLSVDLFEYADLRNAIVHSSRNPQVIAYPTVEVVEEIEAIRENLKNPPNVYTLFRKDVIHVNEGASLKEILDLLKRYNISQIPVFSEGKVLSIINGNTIARWLANEEIVSTFETTTAALAANIEFLGTYGFISRSDNVYTAADIFSNSLQNGWYMDALFITQNGKNGEALLGIIVLEDIAKWMK